MDKIQDVYGYFANYDDYFHKEDQWYGRLLVKEDNIVEGVAEDFFGDEHYFLHGTINKDSISIMRFTVNGESRHANKYSGSRINSRFYGTCFATDSFVEIPLGDCKIAIRSADNIREITDEEVKKIEDSINMMKDKLTSEQKEVYQAVVNGEHENKVERSVQKVFLTK